MKILINSAEEVYPKLDALDEMGISYKKLDNGQIEVTYEGKSKVLLFFVISKHRIVASGNLTKKDEGSYTCERAFRFFSEMHLTATDFILTAQLDVAQLDDLNRIMLESTAKSGSKEM